MKSTQRLLLTICSLKTYIFFVLSFYNFWCPGYSAFHFVYENLAERPAAIFWQLELFMSEFRLVILLLFLLTGMVLSFVPQYYIHV